MIQTKFSEEDVTRQSSKIGKNVLIGGQVGISGHLKIADQTKIVAQSGIPSSIKKAQTLMGTPGIPIDEFKKSYFGFRKLPFLLKKVQELEQKIEALTKKKWCQKNKGP